MILHSSTLELFQVALPAPEGGLTPILPQANPKNRLVLVELQEPSALQFCFRNIDSFERDVTVHRRLGEAALSEVTLRHNATGELTLPILRSISDVWIDRTVDGERGPFAYVVVSIIKGSSLDGTVVMTGPPLRRPSSPL